jgi:hypothetical protein
MSVPREVPPMNADHDSDDAALERALRRSARMFDAPEALVRKAVDLFAARAGSAVPAARPVPSLLRRLATLRFDSGAASPLAFGMRAPAAGVRQLLYSLAERDIDLRVSGQILGPEGQASVTIRPSEGGDGSTAEVDALGEFHLPPVPGGTYLVAIELADFAIDLPPLRIPLEP